MTQLSKISYIDLRLEAKEKRIPAIIGRAAEISRLERILLKQLSGHAIITAPAGSGKTAFLYGFAAHMVQNPHFKQHIVQLNGQALRLAGQIPVTSSSFYQEAFSGLSNSIVIIDNFGEIAAQPVALQNWLTLLNPLLANNTVRLLLTTTPEELEKINQETKVFKDFFENFKLEPQPTDEQIQILEKFYRQMKVPNISIQKNVFEKIIGYVGRFPALGFLPKAATALLDECIAESKTTTGSQIIPDRPPILKFLLPKTSVVTADTVDTVVSQKTGIPLHRLSGNEKELLKNLSQALKEKIIGQEPALSVLSSVIQRAKLGLRSQNRPLGSFLLLGPSGVGKTETAKTLSELLYGRPQNFLRIDMSEFGEQHTVHRLIGSPPGYVGSESGGQLTNHLLQEPYSLLLLDEIEKAHPKIFDIFLQLLDDGRLTSSQGVTVDATQSIVMATSNLGVSEVLEGFANGLDITNQEQIKKLVFPALLRSFRPEFLNRFDAILVYKPLSVENLLDIALLEIKKIESRTKEHNITFSFDRDELAKQVALYADPRFGARPVKRFVEELCENKITELLLT